MIFQIIIPAWTERDRVSTKCKEGFGFLTFAFRKQIETMTQKQTWSTFDRKGRMPQRAEPRFQRVEPRSMKNNCQGVEMNPNQESHNMVLAGFQNCYGTVIVICLLFYPFLKGIVYSRYSRTGPLYIKCV